MTERIWGEYYRNTKTGQIERYVPFHPGQKAIWDNYDSRFVFFISGKGAAKSSFAPIWLDREIRKNPAGNFIICAPTFPLLDQGIKPHFMRQFDAKASDGETPLNDLCGRWVENKKLYELSTGGVVFFRSLEEAERINAIHADAIVVDEGLMVPRRTWDILESRVALRKGKILVTSTPYRRYRWPLDLIAKHQAGDKNYHVVQVPSNINPSFDNDEFERLKATKPKWLFEQDYCGLFAMPEGTIYPSLRECVVSRSELSGLPQGELVAGIDWGHGAAPTSAVVGVRDCDDTLWIFYEYYRQADFLTAANEIKSWHNALHAATNRTVSKWYCDSATDTWRSLRKFKCGQDDFGPTLNAKPAKKGGGSVDYGIDLVTARLKTGRLKIVEGPVRAMLEEAGLYRYEVDEEGNGSPVPKGPCHALDALRYLIMGLDRKRAILAK